ncbi:DNA-directed RNA polymerase subunit omega [Lactococcus hircilactis]|uniref:DNA-directed RNA polymerase subunit omega n=2 Tax=Lactococcus hircilactis TaxID=1494462 RepID=A0A7X1Z998_9LACT|nr:DNA-directed RNA polymerase subunit omega [Lactococcus hircilactis]
MLEPSIDKLLEKVDSKYSLVILEAKRAHELHEGERATQKEYKSVKNTLRALEEIANGTVTIHPAPEAKRHTLVERRELEHLEALMAEKKIKDQIAQEEKEEEEKQKGNRAKKTSVEVEVEIEVESEVESETEEEE